MRQCPLGFLSWSHCPKLVFATSQHGLGHDYITYVRYLFIPMIKASGFQLKPSINKCSLHVAMKVVQPRPSRGRVGSRTQQTCCALPEQSCLSLSAPSVLFRVRTLVMYENFKSFRCETRRLVLQCHLTIFENSVLPCMDTPQRDSEDGNTHQPSPSQFEKSCAGEVWR